MIGLQELRFSRDENEAHGCFHCPKLPGGHAVAMVIVERYSKLCGMEYPSIHWERVLIYF